MEYSDYLRQKGVPELYIDDILHSTDLCFITSLLMLSETALSVSLKFANQDDGGAILNEMLMIISERISHISTRWAMLQSVTGSANFDSLTNFIQELRRREEKLLFPEGVPPPDSLSQQEKDCFDDLLKGTDLGEPS